MKLSCLMFNEPIGKGQDVASADALILEGMGRQDEFARQTDIEFYKPGREAPMGCTIKCQGGANSFASLYAFIESVGCFARTCEPGKAEDERNAGSRKGECSTAY